MCLLITAKFIFPFSQFLQFHHKLFPTLESEPENDSGLEDSCSPVPRVTAVIIPDGQSWSNTNENDVEENAIKTA